MEMHAPLMLALPDLMAEACYKYADNIFGPVPMTQAPAAAADQTALTETTSRKVLALVNGIWEFSYTTDDESEMPAGTRFTGEMTLRQSGTSVTGAWRNPDAAGAVLGTVSGTGVTLTCYMPAQVNRKGKSVPVITRFIQICRSGEVDIHADCTPSGEQMAGTFSAYAGGALHGTFAAARRPQADGH